MNVLPMDIIFLRTLRMMETWLWRIEELVPPPVRVPFSDSFVYRYSEKSLEQALVQKIARVITGLHSARILLNHGFFQEQASIQRMIDEFDEDIMFLASGQLYGKITDLHQRFLDAFYQEEFDNPESALGSTQKRPSIPRKKIRAFISNHAASIASDMAGLDEEGLLADPSRGIEVERTLSKAYSGFVHGASPQIMNMYGGTPRSFQVSGMLGTPNEKDHREDLWNYFYRGLCSFQLITRTLGEEELAKKIEAYRFKFVEDSGKEI